MKLPHSVKQTNLQIQTFVARNRLLVFVVALVVAAYISQHPPNIDELSAKFSGLTKPFVTAESHNVIVPELPTGIATVQSNEAKRKIQHLLDTGEKWQIVLLLPEHWDNDAQSRAIVNVVRDYNPNEYWSHICYRVKPIEIVYGSPDFDKLWLKLAPPVKDGYPALIVSANSSTVFVETGVELVAGGLVDRIVASLERHRP